MDIDKLRVTLNDDFDEMRVMFELFQGDWLVRCFVWYGLDQQGEMYRIRSTPDQVPKEMVELLHKHRSKLKAFFLLSRK